MYKYTIRKQFKFEMAHQLYNSYSKDCHQNLHGHSYVLELYFSSDHVDDSGMVIDFGHIKDLINDYVKSWDHSLTMPNMFDKQYLDMLRKYTKKFRVTEYNPTAQNMARDIFINITKIINCNNLTDIKLDKVRLHQTVTGWAEFSI